VDIEALEVASKQFFVRDKQGNANNETTYNIRDITMILQFIDISK
jgi:hypothetical protein